MFKPAHFDMCEECGRHGRIVFSDGGESEEVGSIEDAFLDLEVCKIRCRVDILEVPELQKQIKDSRLPDRISQSERMIDCNSLLNRMFDPLGSSRMHGMREGTA